MASQIALSTVSGILLDARYEVQKLLDEGTYGQVVKCLDTETSKNVAIKILKNNDPDIHLREIFILEALRTADPDKWHIVRYYNWFWHEKCICLNFEVLDLTLYEYMKQRQFKPLTMAEIRSVLHQLNTALQLLADRRIIHRDIKPDNIMIVDCNQQPLQVKLIDFGIGCYAGSSDQELYVQALWYRAPEVLLGLTYDEPIDMWSLGVVMGELALGYPLFPGNHEYDMIKDIVDSLGQPPDYQLKVSDNNMKYFNNVNDTWRLKTPEEFAELTQHHYKNNRCFHSLCALEKIIYDKHLDEKIETYRFLDLFKMMLDVDCCTRILPFQVAKHPFFSVEMHSDSISKTNMENMTLNMEEPNVSQQLSSQKMSGLPSVLTPHEDTVSAGPDSICVNLRDEDNEAAIVHSDLAEVNTGKPVNNQPLYSDEMCVAFKATTPQTSNKRWERFRGYFRRVRKALSCCFCFGKKTP